MTDERAEIDNSNEMPLRRALFAACPAGASVRDLALQLGTTEAWVDEQVLALWRAHHAARLPNPRGRGAVWRSPMAGDAEAGFLFEQDGEPLRARDGRLNYTPSLATLRRMRAP